MAEWAMDQDDDVLFADNHAYDLDPDFDGWEFEEVEQSLAAEESLRRRHLTTEVTRKKVYPRNLIVKPF